MTSHDSHAAQLVAAAELVAKAVVAQLINRTTDLTAFFSMI